MKTCPCCNAETLSETAEDAGRRGVCLRTIVALLQAGPQPSAKVISLCRGSSEGEVRRAAELLDVRTSVSSGVETWHLSGIGPVTV